jgi:HipA-like protein
MRELGIWMDGQRIGTLDGTDSRNLQISYAESWASNPSSTPLSVSMPLASPVHSGKTVHAYLWGLLPDNEQVTTRWAKSFHWERLALSARIDSDQLLRDITTMATRLPEVLNEILAPLASSVLTDDETKAAEHIVESIRSWATSRLTKLGSATTK